MLVRFQHLWREIEKRRKKDRKKMCEISIFFNFKFFCCFWVRNMIITWTDTFFLENKSIFFIQLAKENDDLYIISFPFFLSPIKSNIQTQHLDLSKQCYMYVKLPIPAKSFKLLGNEPNYVHQAIHQSILPLTLLLLSKYERI